MPQPTQAPSIKQVAHDSPDYWQCVDLRSAVLRKPLGLAFSPEDLAAEHDSIHLALFAGQEVIGCLVLKPVKPTTFKMRQVAVDPQYRGQSLGRALVLASETLARSIGVDKLVLHAREVAVPFYLKLDYQIEGDRFVEVGVDHFKMSKAL